jgi:hypothetical protein
MINILSNETVSLLSPPTQSQPNYETNEGKELQFCSHYWTISQSLQKPSTVDFISRYLLITFSTNWPLPSYTHSIQYCHVYECDSGRGFGLETGFIDHFKTRLFTTLIYSAIANFHTLQFARGHTFPARSVLTSSCLVTAFRAQVLCEWRLSFYCVFFKVRVTLRLAVYRQSVHLGARSLEAHNQRFFPAELLR